MKPLDRLHLYILMSSHKYSSSIQFLYSTPQGHTISHLPAAYVMTSAFSRSISGHRLELSTGNLSYRIAFCKRTMIYMVAVLQRAAVDYGHFRGFGRIRTFVVCHRQHVGVGGPSFGVDPGIEVHQPTVGKLIDIEVCHFSVVDTAHPYPVLSLDSGHFRKPHLVWSLLKDHCIHGLHAVGNLRKMQ